MVHVFFFERVDMAWLFDANCHVRIYLARPVGVLPPIAAPDYDGPAQLLAPTRITTPSLTTAWVLRLFVPATALFPLTSVAHPTPLITYVSFINDPTGAAAGWWQATDLSPHTSQDSTPGLFDVDGSFIALTSV
jgi:hypothetical protein